MTNLLEQLRVVVWHKQQNGEYDSNAFAAKEIDSGFEIIDWHIKAPEINEEEVKQAYPEAQKAYDEALAQATHRSQLLHSLSIDTLESLANVAN